MAKLDGYYILVESEDPAYDNEVTKQPVEKGVNLTDHVQRAPRSMPLSGVVAGPDAAKTKDYLTRSSDSGRIVKYVGRNSFTGLITGLTTSHDNTVADGFNFSFTLIEVQIATSTPVSQLPAPMKSQAAPVISSGTKQPKTKDDKKKKTSSTSGKAAPKKKEKPEVKKVQFKKGSKWE
ncbi:phage baseplate protein [Paenibacillus sepulcri]|uniref:Dit-like phage tail protein N-terminal domain-containing protein n=1 Tax=Paenibacillus sepulcri TaxID=359917 RepID=A0ABS7BUW1_9BACL|nr:hypothetical protein [Paenibacillus sepulcri]